MEPEITAQIEEVRKACDEPAEAWPWGNKGTQIACRSLLGIIEALEAENKLLRSPMDQYTAEGELLLPRGWIPIDGGRYDELETAEADLRAVAPVVRAARDTVRWWQDGAGTAPIIAALDEVKHKLDAVPFELLERLSAMEEA